MDDKSTVPPYEANPTQYSQHAQQTPMHTADSYGSAPGQPMVQHDIYQGQNPISPMQTGTTNQYPNQPLGSPPLETAQYHQPQMNQSQPMGSPGVNHPKGDYYNQGQQQHIPMQQAQHPGMHQQPSQYQTAIPLGNLTGSAAPVDCPICRQRAMTRTEHHSGNTTHVWALVLCACLCLGCIPYLISGTKDVEHKCGNCGVLLATWHKSGHTDIHAHA